MSKGDSKFVIWAALIGNGLISVIKFIAAFLSGSSAMLSEGIHSLVDTGNQVLLLYGLKRAAKPADKNFPFGHGKEIYFWSFVVAISIFGIGAVVAIYEGVHHLLEPTELKDVSMNYIVLGLAIVFESFVWLVAVKEFRRVKGKHGFFAAVKYSKDPSIFVVLFEDTAALLGLLVALLGTYLGDVHNIWWADGGASIVIGLILAGTAAWLAYETKSLLIGEAAAQEDVDGIRQLADEVDGVEKVKEVLTVHMGPDFVLANITVDFDNEVRAGQIEEAIEKLDSAIKARYPAVKRVFVELESQ
ncbi:MAG: cation diffusion facilitator family transporter [Planctomycetota bacterium]|nr:cation diffusion facilitator family transporter [Planctomycetota bacterium]